MYIKAIEASKMLGMTTSGFKLKALEDPKIRKKRDGLLWFFHSDDIMRIKHEKESLKKCKCCEKRFRNVNDPDEQWCKNKGCRAHKKEWSRANWDQLDHSNNFRKKYEAEFWEVTPTQEKQFATFFSLVRPPQEKKIRKCLKCARSFEMPNRICAECHAVISKVGALASC